MSELKDRATQLAELMREFGLAEAELKGDGYRVAFKRTHLVAVEQGANGVAHHDPASFAIVNPAGPAAPEAQKGTPVNSPMTGIYYSAPSPNAPPFVKEGDTVEAGQVVALIEAMKVFNEITAPMAGTVLKLAAQNGEIVNPGDALIYIG